MDNTLFPELEHDHRVCVERAMIRAKEVCAREGVKLTPLRESVLRALLSSHQALGAYEIIERMSQEGRRLSPISVYRIIDVLLALGLVRRLESRSAFFASHARHDGARQMLVLVCAQCNRVVEVESSEAWRAFGALTQANDFAVTNVVVEIQGACRDCLATAPAEVRSSALSEFSRQQA